MVKSIEHFSVPFPWTRIYGLDKSSAGCRDSEGQVASRLQRGRTLCFRGLSTGLCREQHWRFPTNTALSQNTRNRSYGEPLTVARCPVVKVALLKVCVPVEQGTGVVGKNIISSCGTPAVYRIMGSFVNKLSCIEETHGSIVHEFFLT